MDLLFGLDFRKNILFTTFATEQIASNLICRIDEKSEETGNSLSLACGIHTNDAPISPEFESKLGKSEKSTDCESLVIHTPFESNIDSKKKLNYLTNLSTVF